MRLFDETPVRPAAVAAARLLEALGFAATLAAVVALGLAAHRLAGMAEAYYAAGGGSEFVGYVRRIDGPDAAKALLPGLHLRALWFSMAWACAVFAAGFACLAIAGGRSLYWRTLAILRAL